MRQFFGDFLCNIYNNYEVFYLLLTNRTKRATIKVQKGKTPKAARTEVESNGKGFSKTQNDFRGKGERSDGQPLRHAGEKRAENVSEIKLK